MHRILIVEDSDDEARALEGHLDHYAREHGLELEVEHLHSAAELLDDGPEADLIFMDISLPDISGMEAARLLRAAGRQTPLMFVTNLAQYAMCGYQVGALGFVVKTSSYGDFSLCMNRAVRALAKNERRTLGLPTKDGLRVLAVTELVSVEAQARELVFHLADGSTLAVRMGLAELEGQLEGCQAPVLRISPGCLANMAHIHQIFGSDLHMDDGSVLRISRGRRAEALASIASYLGGGS